MAHHPQHHSTQSIKGLSDKRRTDTNVIFVDFTYYSLSLPSLNNFYFILF